MRKLKLDIDDLKVDSFAATPAHTDRGTVHGRLPTGEDPDFTIMLCGSAGTCIGPTYCCPVSWLATNCGTSCGFTYCGFSCAVTLVCRSCDSCVVTCNEAGASCTYVCYNCAV